MKIFKNKMKLKRVQNKKISIINKKIKIKIN